ncbi:hypothetical protein STEG23_022194 [Scotinomys teguina]
MSGSSNWMPQAQIVYFYHRGCRDKWLQRNISLHAFLQQRLDADWLLKPLVLCDHSTGSTLAAPVQATENNIPSRGSSRESKEDAWSFSIVHTVMLMFLLLARTVVPEWSTHSTHLTDSVCGKFKQIEKKGVRRLSSYVLGSYNGAYKERRFVHFNFRCCEVQGHEGFIRCCKPQKCEVGIQLTMAIANAWKKPRTFPEDEAKSQASIGATGF